MNCRTCGACCLNPLDDKWIEVTESDSINPHLLQEGDITPYSMKQIYGRCVCLKGEIGKNTKCMIYEDRPAICKWFQSETPACLFFRKLHGVQ